MSLLLNSLSADIDIELIQDLNSDGVDDADEVIAFSENQDTTAELISTTLRAGTYYTRVYPFDITLDSNSNYNLTLSAIAV